MKNRTFKIDEFLYDEGEKVFKKSSIEIQPRLTVLVGCNGSGKSTLLKMIHRQLKKEKIPVLTYDNLHDGGIQAKSEAIMYGDYSFVADSWSVSEGEEIVANMERIARKIGNFIRSNKSDNDELWILLDAIDSGLSIDNIIDLKEDLFKTVLSITDNDCYIVVSANEYEMCYGEKCFSVQDGEYVTIKNYYEYKQLIMKTKEKKRVIY